MTPFEHCKYCSVTLSVGLTPSRQGVLSLQGVGYFCSTNCARVYFTLKPSAEPAFAPDALYRFQNPPLAYRVIALVREPHVSSVVIAESRDASHAMRMASAYPYRAVVQDWHSKRTFDNGKAMAGSEVA